MGQPTHSAAADANQINAFVRDTTGQPFAELFAGNALHARIVCALSGPVHSAFFTGAQNLSGDLLGGVRMIQSRHGGRHLF